MAAEHVQVIREMQAAYLRGDVEAASELLDPEIEWLPGIPGRRVYRGREGVADFFRSWLSAWEEYEFELLELVDAGDGRVVMVFRERGRGRGSGIPLDAVFAGVYDVSDGRVARWERCASREEALERARAAA